MAGLDDEMQSALEADGEKLRQLTGEDHGPFELPEFSVWQFLIDGTQEKVRDHVTAREAVEAARHYTNNVATKMGVTERVIITDGGDDCVFEWKKEEGITFPPEARGRR